MADSKAKVHFYDVPMARVSPCLAAGHWELQMAERSTWRSGPGGSQDGQVRGGRVRELGRPQTLSMGAWCRDIAGTKGACRPPAHSSRLGQAAHIHVLTWQTMQRKRLCAAQ